MTALSIDSGAALSGTADGNRQSDSGFAIRRHLQVKANDQAFVKMCAPGVTCPATSWWN